MKIAMLSPVWLPVPPIGYGGTELIVSYLTEELVRRGHEVTLFASGDSQTTASLDSIFPQAIGNSGDLKDQPLLPLLHYSNCFENADKFDIIHSHAQYYAMFLSQFIKTPVIHTIHGSINKGDVPDDVLLTLNHFNDKNKLISISDAQRTGLPDLNFLATVHNGIDVSTFDYSAGSEDYLLWIGRVAIKKGPLEAIEVAKQAGMKLKMVAAVDPINQKYFDEEVKPHIDDDQITFHGEVSHAETAGFYQKARATLVPIKWNEPFGLVMIESMATGTPVIAFDRGSVSEVIEDGVTGFIVPPSEGIEGMVRAVKRISEIERKSCRERVERLFSIKSMVDGYEKVYERITRKVEE